MSVAWDSTTAADGTRLAYMTKSIAPSSATQRSAAALRASNCNPLSALAILVGAAVAEATARHLVDVSYIPHIHAPNPENSRARSDFCNVLRGLLRLGNIAADDARICASAGLLTRTLLMPDREQLQVDESSCLGRADVACSSGNEHDPVVCHMDDSVLALVHLGISHTKG